MAVWGSSAQFGPVHYQGPHSSIRQFLYPFNSFSMSYGTLQRLSVEPGIEHGTTGSKFRCSTNDLLTPESYTASGSCSHYDLAALNGPNLRYGGGGGGCGADDGLPISTLDLSLLAHGSFENPTATFSTPNRHFTQTM